MYAWHDVAPLTGPTFNTMKLTRVLLFTALALAIATPFARADDDDDDEDVSNPFRGGLRRSRGPTRAPPHLSEAPGAALW